MKKTLYEIYTKNPETGEGGWDIKWVLTSLDIKTYPNFDEVITVDDYSLGLPKKVINF